VQHICGCLPENVNALATFGVENNKQRLQVSVVGNRYIKTVEHNKVDLLVFTQSN
jgi:hypothetical protein